MSDNFTLLTETVVSRPDPLVPMAVGVATEIYSAEIPGGGAILVHNSCRVFIKYHSFAPDTSLDENDIPHVTPYRFGVLAVLEQQQEGVDTWEEIGRQNRNLSEVQSGKEREILVTPQPIATEEGQDTEIIGFDNAKIRLKSAWQDDASGTLRVRLIAMQLLANNETVPANPFESLTVSINGTRFTV